MQSFRVEWSLSSQDHIAACLHYHFLTLATELIPLHFQENLVLLSEIGASLGSNQRAPRGFA
jgi:hypothetical protein